MHQDWYIYQSYYQFLASISTSLCKLIDKKGMLYTAALENIAIQKIIYKMLGKPILILYRVLFYLIVAKHYKSSYYHLEWILWNSEINFFSFFLWKV